MGSTLPMLPARPTWSKWHSVLIGLLAVYLLAIAADVIFTGPTSRQATPINTSAVASDSSAMRASVSMPPMASQSLTSQDTHAIDIRKAYAKIAQDSLTETNVHALVWTAGENQQELHLEYPQTARSMARQMEDETIMFQELRQLGFTRVDVTDGTNFTQHWDLN
jgi:hypothetical protein